MESLLGVQSGLLFIVCGGGVVVEGRGGPVEGVAYGGHEVLVDEPHFSDHRGRVGGVACCSRAQRARR